MTYAEKNEGRLPERLEELGVDLDEYRCPAFGGWEHYLFVDPGAVLQDLPRDAMILKEDEWNHFGEWKNVNRTGSARRHRRD